LIERVFAREDESKLKQRGNEATVGAGQVARDGSCVEQPLDVRKFKRGVQRPDISCLDCLIHQKGGKVQQVKLGGLLGAALADRPRSQAMVPNFTKSHQRFCPLRNEGRLGLRKQMAPESKKEFVG